MGEERGETVAGAFAWRIPTLFVCKFGREFDYDSEINSVFGVRLMVEFVGIGCARDALANTLREQLEEHKCLCAGCWKAHETLAKSILRDAKQAKWYKDGIRRDLKAFDDYWTGLKQ